MASEQIVANPARKIYTVSELNRAARTVLETQFPLIWLEGEISNLSRPASGHLYFSLKDGAAQIRCALFRNRSRLLKLDIANGQQVVVRARLSLYEPRGDYQLIVEHVEQAGEGVLRREFEALKARLDAEGLFAAENKRALPLFPRRLGVITSPSGAAIRDVLSVLKRRFPALPVVIYPTPVQGSDAASQIAAAIDTASARRDSDVLLLVRGGGSLEDLWAFNQEPVARAIYRCALPLVSGVGHEIDITIADFVADSRAPTPSAAAELASPDWQQWLGKFQHQRQRLIDAAERRLRQHRQGLDWLSQALARQHPGQRLRIQTERLQTLQSRLTRAEYSLRLQQRHRFERLQTRLNAAAQHRSAALSQLSARRHDLERRLLSAGKNRLTQLAQRLAAAGRSLHDLSPLQTLARGYAVVSDADSGKLISDASQTRVGDGIDVRLRRGRLRCRIENSAAD